MHKGSILRIGTVVDLPSDTAKYLLSTGDIQILQYPKKPENTFSIPYFEIPSSVKPIEISVIVTTHEKYLKYLPECLASVDKQDFVKDKIVVFDKCDPVTLPLGWQGVRVDYGTPNPARNFAISKTSCPWILIVDGDNWLAHDYCRAAAAVIEKAPVSTAIVYADIQSVCNDGSTQIQKMPEYFDYWQLRKQNYISVTSLMRRDAVLEAGGFQDTDCYDDWTLAQNITALGWTAIKNPIPIPVRENSDDLHRRTRIENPDKKFKWNQRTYSILTLLAGRENCFDDWKNFLLKSELPEKVELWLLDNSKNSTFKNKLKKTINQFQDSKRFKSIHLMESDLSPDINDKYWRGKLVAKLYNLILPKIQTDMLIMLEDDVVPPPDGLHTLINTVAAKTKIAGISGLYQTRTGGDAIVGSWTDDFSTGRIMREQVRPEPMKCGCIAGGFTVWNNACIKDCLPLRFDHSGAIPFGWDTNLSRQLRFMGCGLYIHGGVECQHKI